MLCAVTSWGMRLGLGLAIGLGLAGCDSWAMNPNPPETATVEGCAEAVQHLHECCPAYSSYLSCSYRIDAVNANALLDLTVAQSRCLRKQSCEAIARAVKEQRRLCDLSFAGTTCR